MQIACPAARCGAVMNLPENAMGKKGRCPRCMDAFIVAPELVVPAAEASAEAAAASAPAPASPPTAPCDAAPAVPPPPIAAAPAQPAGVQEALASPTPATPAAVGPAAVGPRRDSARRVRAQTSPDTFEPERRIAAGGIWIGLAAMVVAVIWFVAGWYAGSIYIYAPVLFIIGLIGLVRGLGEAAAGGGRRGRPRARRG